MITEAFLETRLNQILRFIIRLGNARKLCMTFEAGRTSLAADLRLRFHKHRPPNVNGE